MTSNAKIDLITDDETATVLGTGELDLRISDEFGRLLTQAMQSGLRVVVDFRVADFIDSAILAVLARAGTMMLAKERRLAVLVSEGRHPDYVLRTVGFGEIMDVVVSKADGK